MKICKSAAQNFTAKIVTMEQVKKVAIPTICCQQNIKNQRLAILAMVKSAKSAINSRAKIATKFIKITQDYGVTIKNALK